MEINVSLLMGLINLSVTLISKCLIKLELAIHSQEKVTAVMVRDVTSFTKIKNVKLIWRVH